MAQQSKEDLVQEWRTRALELVEKYHIKTLPARKDGEMWVWNGKYYNRYGQQEIAAELLNGQDGRYLTPSDADKVLKYIASVSLTGKQDPKSRCINLENGVLEYDVIGQIIFKKREDISAPWDYNFTNIVPIVYDPAATCPIIDTVLQQILVDKGITEQTKVKENYDEWAERWKEYESQQSAYADYMAEKYLQYEINMLPIPGEQDWGIRKAKTAAEDSIDEKIRKIYIFEEYLGLCLMSDYEIKKALLFVGRNDTGKTTVINIVEQFLSESNVAHLTLQRLDVTQSPFSPEKLRDKMANIADEMPIIPVKTLDTFKNVVGGGKISASVKYSDDVIFTNTAKMLFTANELPSLSAAARNSVLNRFVIVEFLNEFIATEGGTNRKIKDKRYEAKELSGLLNHAIAGLQRLLKHGSFTYDDEDTPTLWEKWQTMTNPLEEFFIVRVEITRRKEDIVPKSLLYEWYQAYCIENKVTVSMSLNKFSRAVAQMDGVKSDKKYDANKTKESGASRMTNYWVGIRRRTGMEAPVLSIE